MCIVFRLKDWVSKAADREREKEERRRQRRERRLAQPRHNFDDRQYHEQKSQVINNLDEAVQKGIE